MSTFLSVAAMILAFAMFFGMIWGAVKYIKACSYYYYTPLKITECVLSVVSVLCPIFGLGASGAISSSVVGIPGMIFSAVVLLGGILMGIFLVLYLIRRIESQTGSRKFAVASFVVQMFFGYLGLASAGLFLLIGVFLINKIGRNDEF